MVMRAAAGVDSYRAAASSAGRTARNRRAEADCTPRPATATAGVDARRSPCLTILGSP